MSHIINNKRSKIKDKPIKSLVLLTLLLIVIVVSLVSCKQPPESIRMFDMNQISNIDYEVTSFTDDLLVTNNNLNLSIADANDTESFMVIKNLIHTYETTVFETAKNKETLTVNNNLDQKELSLLLNTKNNTKSLKSYELQLSMSDLKGLLIGPEGSIHIEEDLVTKILQGDMIDTDVDYSTLPLVELVYNNEVTELNWSGTWNYLVYTNRFLQETTTNEYTSQPLKLDSYGDASPLIRFGSALPSQLIINIYQDNRTGKLMSSDTLFPKESEILVKLPELNGSYYIKAMASWDNNSETSYGEISYSFEAQVEVSESFTLSQDTYQPGDLIVVRGNYIDPDLNYTIESDLYNQGLAFQKSGHDYYILLPIMSKATLGTYSLSITDNDYPDKIQTLNFDVVYKEFDEQYLETSGSTASLQNNDNYDQLNEAFARGRANLSEEKLWDGTFVQPVGGRISTEYGQIRYTNGSENSSRHSGIDFANPTGTLIVATQNGYVTLAEELNITGNTLFIDHGFGIVSQYYHTNKILVSVGDYVTTGQSVAEVGSTGFSTGPHLHFAIYNKGIYINPWKFFEQAPF